MDETRLKKIMQDYEAPPPDENAQKRALNLALAEFETAQKEKQKSFQGLSILRRLTGSSRQTRRTPMTISRPFIVGGSFAALTVALLLTTSTFEATVSKPTSTYGGGGGNNFSSIATNITSSKQIEFVPFGKLRSKEAQESNSAPPMATAPANQIASRADKEERWRSISERSQTAQRLSRAETDAPAKIKKNFAAPAEAPAQSLVGRQAPVGGITAEGKGMVMPVSPTVMADEMYDPGYYKDVGRDRFEDFEENAIKLVSQEPVSTFSIDVDTSSYAFMRRQINSGILPQKDAVRIEEMINYFDYDYPLPEAREQPFQPTVAVVPSPWKAGNKLVHIGIKGYDIGADARPHANLVFLLDTSGSMHSPDKLPLVVSSMKLLLESLQPDDTVAIVTYAGSAGTVLEPTKASDKDKILQALDRLNAGGSTAGAEGIRQAYQLAESRFDKEAVNRVILATDGDFNVGITNPEELKDFVERKRETGIFLSVLGFGQGNLNDHMMQELAQNGNGVAAYIDTLNEARKVLVEEATSTLFPIAKDVKIQVEFNPATVAEYRLIGYETRHLNREDFNNDAVDAGDIGAGHTVTAIYEITPVGSENRMVDDSRYKPAEKATADTDFGGEYAFLKLRYKLPDGDKSRLITTPVSTANDLPSMENPPAWLTQETGWATAVAGFGQLLKGGKYLDSGFTYDDVIALAQQTKGADEFGYRAEFIQLVRLAKSAAALQKN